MSDQSVLLSAGTRCPRKSSSAAPTHERNMKPVRPHSICVWPSLLSTNQIAFRAAERQSLADADSPARPDSDPLINLYVQPTVPSLTFCFCLSLCLLSLMLSALHVANNWRERSYISHDCWNWLSHKPSISTKTLFSSFNNMNFLLLQLLHSVNACIHLLLSVKPALCPSSLHPLSLRSSSPAPAWQLHLHHSLSSIPALRPLHTSHTHT